MKTVYFTYRMSDLQTEIEGLTSVQGRLRGDKDNGHLQDRLSLTKGDSFLFDSFIREASAKTYNWMQAFGKHICRPYRVFDKATIYNVEEDCGVYIEYDNEAIGKAAVIPSKGFKMYKTIGGIRSQVNRYNVGDNMDFLVTIPAMKIYKGQSSSYKYKWTITMTLKGWGGVPGDSVEEYKSLVVESGDITATTNTVFADNATIGSSSVPVTWDWGIEWYRIEHIDSVLFEVVEITPATALNVKVGEYVYEALRNGKTLYFQCRKDYNSDGKMWEITPEYFEMLNDDWCDCIVYHLESPCWQDMGMFATVDDTIRQALIKYVEWKWYKFSLHSEAPEFRDEWEDLVKEIQMGLNGESKKLRRRYKYY